MLLKQEPPSPSIAILGNTESSFVPIMAEGLQRMFGRINVKAQVFNDGLERLSEVHRADPWFTPSGARALASAAAKRVLRQSAATASFLEQLRAFSAVVIVGTIPRAFLRTFFSDESVRAALPHTPLILYDVFYLPTRGPWARWLREGNPDVGVPDGGHWGLNRYDWYLCSSVVSECPFPAGAQPCSVIGLDLADGTLFPDQRDQFMALIDFAQPYTQDERRVQVAACERAGVPYVVLEGKYSISDIRALYRQTSAYFVSMRESFGLPICELQECGSHVLTPYSHWCPSHWLKPDPRRAGPGDLSPNFVVYNNDVDELIAQLVSIRTSHAPHRVVDTFHRYHPQFVGGDLDALEDFCDRLARGAITSASHLTDRWEPSNESQMWENHFIRTSVTTPREVTQA